jgi:hypothetical protein
MLAMNAPGRNSTQRINGLHMLRAHLHSALISGSPAIAAGNRLDMDFQ